MGIKCFLEMTKGMVTYIPGLGKVLGRGTGGTVSARYCYSVWLRHLVTNFQNGLRCIPRVVAELGPGDSLGIGLAAILSGASEYYALDVVKDAETERNLRIFDALVDLFRRRENIPGPEEFPRINPPLASYRFPDFILTNDILQRALCSERIEMIRRAVSGLCKNKIDEDQEVKIVYFVPWYDSGIVKAGSVDMIYSQAVLEHVDDLEKTYQALNIWLKGDGVMSHAIDFSSHGRAREWNGNWGYSDLTWRIIRGRRSYLLNREPLSTHIKLLEKYGFALMHIRKNPGEGGIGRKNIAARFKHFAEEDLNTKGVFLVAVKRTELDKAR